MNLTKFYNLTFLFYDSLWLRHIFLKETLEVSHILLNFASTKLASPVFIFEYNDSIWIESIISTG